MGVEYKIKTSMKTPWFIKSYVEYQIIKHWVEFEMDWPSHYGEDRNFCKIIFKTKDKELVEKFVQQLQEKFDEKD